MGDFARVSKPITDPGDPTIDEEGTGEDRPTPGGIPSDKTPQEFYAEMIARADVRAILAELADR